MKTEALRVRIEGPLKERLRKIAKGDQRSMSSLVVLALTEYADASDEEIKNKAKSLLRKRKKNKDEENGESKG